MLAIAIHRKHYLYTSRLADVRDAIVRSVSPNDVILCNTMVGKLFHPGLGTRNFRSIESIALVERDKAEVISAVKDASRRVYIITWQRAGRPDDLKEIELIRKFVGERQCQSINLLGSEFGGEVQCSRITPNLGQ